jgi:hypothetical protein
LKAYLRKEEPPVSANITNDGSEGEDLLLRDIGLPVLAIDHPIQLDTLDTADHPYVDLVYSLSPFDLRINSDVEAHRLKE